MDVFHSSQGLPKWFLLETVLEFVSKSTVPVFRSVLSLTLARLVRALVSANFGDVSLHDALATQRVATVEAFQILVLLEF